MRRMWAIFVFAITMAGAAPVQYARAQDMPPQPQADALSAPALPAPSAQPQAAPQGLKTVTVSGAEIVLPQMADYREIFGEYPQLDALFRQFVPSTNTLQAVYLSRADIEALRKNPNGGFHDYIMVQSLTQDMVLRNADDFKVVKEQVKSGFKNTDDMSTLAQKELDTASAYMNKTYKTNTHLAIGQTRVAGIPVDDAQALSMTVLANYGYSTQQGKVGVPMVMSLNVINIDNRVLYLFVYNKYKSDDDIAAVTRTADAYRHALFALNAAPASDAAAQAQDAPASGHDFMWARRAIVIAAALALVFVFIGLTGMKGKLRDAVLGHKDDGSDKKDNVL